MTPTIEHVSVGTELLLGDTIDSNVVFGSRALVARGLRVARRTTVGDSVEEIRDAVGAALDRTGLVLVCGGLGPTNDDLTREAVAELLDMPLAFDESVWAELVERWRRIGREISDSNRSQAMVPRGGVVLPNRWGSAPGLWLDAPRGLVILLPGVPLEFRGLLEEQVIPRLQQRLELRAIRSRVLRTTGIAESKLGEILGPLEAGIAPVTLAYLPDQSGVDLRLTAWGMAEAEADAALAEAERVVRDAVGAFVFASGSTDLAAVLIDLLRDRKLTMATAESCTGGLIGARVTAIAGSSDVYLGGVVSYANAVKEAQLGVRAETLRAHGAVSEETAREMVQGVASRFGADVAIAVTGIAGPGGGSPDKPVGTVWFAWLVEGRVDAERIGFAGDRSQVRERAAQMALLGVVRRLRPAPQP
jgi:nicotinamide-nucleotide amidase